MHNTNSNEFKQIIESIELNNLKTQNVENPWEKASNGNSVGYLYHIVPHIFLMYPFGEDAVLLMCYMFQT